MHESMPDCRVKNSTPEHDFISSKQSKTLQINNIYIVKYLQKKAIDKLTFTNLGRTSDKFPGISEIMKRVWMGYLDNTNF